MPSRRPARLRTPGMSKRKSHLLRRNLDPPAGSVLNPRDSRLNLNLRPNKAAPDRQAAAAVGVAAVDEVAAGVSRPSRKPLLPPQ
jgi:hypothetical protein